MKLTLSTPEVESKTTNTVKLKELTLQNMLSPGEEYAYVIVSEGETSGGSFTEHRTRSIKISASFLLAEVTKTPVNGDDVRQSLERAVLAAIQAEGNLAAGTLE